MSFFIQSRINENNKAHRYAAAFDVFHEREVEDFAEARNHRGCLNRNRGGASMIILFGMNLSEKEPKMFLSRVGRVHN